LESILYNFISNAIRYSHPKRKPLIVLQFNEKEKALSIADNGIGIDLKRNGENLFGMYKTFNNNPDAKGIGLFITKNQIDAMGGRIETKSEIDEGTTFTIYFK
jgi:signal transduction histidine kinase